MAQRIPEEVIEEVRHQTNIVDVIGQYVQLKKSGKNYMGLCPFHNEHSPSFSVAEDKQMYHCFGCGNGGNVFKFLQEIEGISFPEAVAKTIDLGNLTVDWSLSSQSDRSNNKEDSSHTALIQLHEKAADLFQHMLLNTKAGEKAFGYLKDRGLTLEQIEQFQIGFAPKERILLQQVFKNDAVPEEKIAASGLMIQRDNGEWVDRFYQRIMFPIKNAQGKIIAFSGRLLEEETVNTKEMPKYLNSPETELFNKRTTLFNFDKARGEARKENEIILFEGFMDVISAWGVGIKHGVASMGTSLTNEQIQMIQRVTPNVLICYDGDRAGFEATHRAIQLLTDNSSLDMSIIHLPEKLDPDEYIKKYGASSFVELVHHGRETVFTFKMNYHKQGKNLDNETEKLTYIHEVIAELAKVSSIVEREMYIKQLTATFHFSEESIQQELAEHLAKNRQTRQENRETRRQEQHIEKRVVQEQQKRKIDRIEKAERILLYRTINEKAIQNQLNQLPDFSFVHDEYQEIYQHYSDYMLLNDKFEHAGFLDYLQDEQLKKVFIEVSYLELDEESSAKEIADCLKVVQLSKIEAIRRTKQAELNEAKQMGNQQRQEELTIEIINLTRAMQRNK